MYKKIAALIPFVCCSLFAQDLYPVKNHKANAVIVIAQNADRVEKFAAKELQEAFHELQ